MRRISLLGSTGSIGRQSLDVISACGMTVAALTANRDAARMEEQARRFKPELAVMMDQAAAADLRVRLADTDTRVASGPEGLEEAAALPSADTVITAVVGMVGLKPTLAAIAQGKRIALANKETLVCGGELVMSEAKRCGAEIVPVDSEHSALFQSLQGCRDRGEVRRLILTASGGPFFGYTREQLEHVTLDQALRHPNWSMGAKITVDSATLMNKGLEFIEAMRLYHMPPEKISVVVHRESIIHSLVEFMDLSMLAQLGVPDMRIPIQYALTYPHRMPSPSRPLSLTDCGTLHFAEPDYDTFLCLAACRRALQRGGLAPAAANGANEEAVQRFFEGKISFLEIGPLVMDAMLRQETGTVSLESVLEADRAAREYVNRMVLS